MPVTFSITMTVATTASNPISRYNCLVPLSTFFIAFPLVLFAIVPKDVGYKLATRIRVRNIATTAPISTPELPLMSPRLFLNLIIWSIPPTYCNVFIARAI